MIDMVKKLFCLFVVITLWPALPVYSADSIDYKSITESRDFISHDIYSGNYYSYINPAVSQMFITSQDTDSSFSINYHKVLGWSTLTMMCVTIGTGFFIPDGAHCALAGVTTGMAVVTCADGIYEYGGLISLKDGDWRYNTHALLGMLATAGFITTLALADGEGHIATGIASGVTFTVAVGVIYF